MKFGSAFSVQKIVHRAGTERHCWFAYPIKTLNEWNLFKMLALKSVKGIFKFMGLLLETDAPWFLLHYVKNVLISIPLLTLLYPLCAYFHHNMSILLNATDAFYVIAATLLCLGQYWFLVMQKQPLRCLFSELRALIDQSECRRLFNFQH